jgi:hypothetical protein
MFDIFNTIIDQLGGTLKWLWYGFIFTILLVFLLKKTELIVKKGVIGTLILAVYYIIFPVVIGITSWFYAATKHVENDLNKISTLVIDSVEDAILPSFETYIYDNLQEYLEVSNIPNNDEIVSSFLLESEESGWLKKQVLHWTLVESLEYLEKKALEEAGKKIGKENLNIKALALDKKALNIPFKYLKEKSKKTIRGFLASYYIVYYFLYGLVTLILLLDVYFSFKNKNKTIDHSVLIENDNLKIK